MAAYYPTKIAFPSPPPTSNALTAQQRSQLLRSTQKLGRILGTTPALIEEHEEMPSMIPLNLQRLAVPLHVGLSSKYTDDDALARYSSSETSSLSDYDTPSYIRRSSSVSSKSGSMRSMSPVHANEPWPTPSRSQADRPFLRIAVPNPSRLDAIPQSPPGFDSPPPAYYPGPHAHASYTLRPVPVASRPPPSPPAFVPTIPSATSMRRHKMDKLRRTLGDGVPVGLVFPTSSDDASDSDDDDGLPRAAPRPPRIRSARDSLHLPRHAHVAVPPMPVSPPALSAPTSRAAKKLSMIAERDEAYAYAYAAGPGAGYSPTSDRGSIDSERYQGDTEAESPYSSRRVSREHRIRRVPVPAV